jgi:hypothetical protein
VDARNQFEDTINLDNVELIDNFKGLDDDSVMQSIPKGFGYALE